MTILKLGVIADDFTGGTDIASFMVNAGWRVIQIIGQPNADLLSMAQLEDVDAIVVSLKSRSCDQKQAIAETLAAAHWLKELGAKQLYFKYCSTFDSTDQGNIGPVSDALMADFNIRQTIFCPALPINGRTVLHGYLFVNGQLLNESGMQNHPITPMKDANLVRVLAKQTVHNVGLIDYNQLDDYARYDQSQIDPLEEILRRAYTDGIRYFITDCAHYAHLESLAQLTKDFALVTGGAGLAEAIARRDVATIPHHVQQELIAPEALKTVILSGSCSRMTNQQVAHYQSLQAPSFAIDVSHAINDPNYAQIIAEWAMIESSQSPQYAPLIFATQDAESLTKTQNTFGIEIASQAVEDLLSKVALILKNNHFKRFIVAGGETSGAVTQALAVTAFEIGVSVAPGVPWVKDIHSDLYFLLKSGNFGTPSFFIKAQE